MKNLNFIFEDYASLKKIIEKNFKNKNDSILIQYFDNRNNYELFEDLGRKLSLMLPNAVVLGTSSAGNILESKICEGSAVISICKFLKTTLIPLSSKTCDYEGAKSIANSIPSSCKAAIFFSEWYNSSPEEFLYSLNESHKNLIIAGGVASNSTKETKDVFLCLNGVTYVEGVVGVAFENPELIVLRDWKLDWNPIGKQMVVTKAQGSTVYELDDQPIIKVIQRYFGDNAFTKLSSKIYNFPLIKTENGVHIARVSLDSKDDGLVFSGNLAKGDIVQFGIIDIYNIINNKKARLLFQPEALWIYSCAGRKSIAAELLEHEFTSFSALQSTSGFFTFGEFFKTARSVKMLNLTTTVFALSEESKFQKLPPLEHNELDEKYHSIAMMSHLTHTVASELEQTIKTLDSYKKAIDKSAIVSRTNAKGILTYINESFEKISGYSKEEAIGKSNYIIYHPDVSKATLKELWQTINKKEMWQGMLTMKSKMGEAFYLDVTIVPILDENGQILEFISLCNDITKIIKQQEQLHKQTVDSLTNLPNRIKLFNDIEVCENPLLAILNIDNFSKINHFYGFENGNALLKEVSLKLQTLLIPLPLAQIYRLAADNFAILYDSCDTDGFYKQIEEIISKLHAHCFLNKEQKVTIRISGGLSSGKKQLLSRAEEALRQAKLRNVFWLPYNEKDEEQHKENFKMSHTIGWAIDNHKIIPHYQAIINLKTGEIDRYESLMRLYDEDNKMYTPNTFLDIAKKSKHYQELTKQTIERALKDFKDRKESISLNISVEDVVNAETVSFLENAIKNFPQPSRISLELTETEVIADYVSVVHFIENFKNLGVKISVDDFGSGYSNFAYIVQFKADFLKIDGSLVSKIATDETSYRVVTAINNFAKSMGMKSIAEFVSDEEINSLVKELEIDYAQGYFHAKPLPIEMLP